MPDLLTMAELSRSTYYYHQQRLTEPNKDQLLCDDIGHLFNEHNACYGYRRMTFILKQLGYLVNKKKVQRLMQLLRLKAVIRAPKKYRSYRGKEGRIAPNILMRKFDCEEPNHKWVTDVTEFRVGDEKLYLSPVLDLFNRQIIAYQLMRKPVYKLVSDMLEKAISTLKSTEKPLIHSDQGWQYQLDSYQQTLASHGFTQSMSRKGNCLDNAVIESFFGTLKCELFYREKFISIEQLEKRIHEYIYYYNHERVSTKLKGLSPVQYRNQSYN